MFNGLGTYTWSSGTSLVGVFENNVCNKVGKKMYPNGQVYVGELAEDQEHGRGVLSDQNGARIVAVWNHGRLSEELVEMIVPAIEVDAIAGAEREQRVFVSARDPAESSKSLASQQDEGHSLVLFTNGDKYIGGVKDGKKNGTGMYVYADGSAHKGTWENDSINGASHPMPKEAEQGELQRLHEMNERNVAAVAMLKQKVSAERKQVPPVYRLQE